MLYRELGNDFASLGFIETFRLDSEEGGRRGIIVIVTGGRHLGQSKEWFSSYCARIKLGCRVLRVGVLEALRTVEQQPF
jgi:hypothetical protein